MVKPVMVRELLNPPALLSTPPAGIEVTVAPVSGEPPSGSCMVKVTTAAPSKEPEATAEGAGGVSGTVAPGITLFDVAEGALVPFALVALTVKVYAVPLVSPVMTWLNPVVPPLLSTPPAGNEVTV